MHHPFLLTRKKSILKAIVDSTSKQPHLKSLNKELSMTIAEMVRRHHSDNHQHHHHHQ